MPFCKRCSGTGICQHCHGKGYEPPKDLGFVEKEVATGVGNQEPTKVMIRVPDIKPLPFDETPPRCSLCKGTGKCKYCSDP